jgi:hypothetical protein
MKKEFGIILSVAVLIATCQLALHDWRGTRTLADARVHVAPDRVNASASQLSKLDPSTQRRILKDYGELPLAFEKNQGQTDSRVKFLSRGAGYTLFLTANQAIFSLHTSDANGVVGEANREDERRQTPVGIRPTSKKSEKQAVDSILRMKLVDANSSVAVSGIDELPGKNDYFIGNDAKRWQTDVPTYAKVKYEGVYSGIDLVYYGNHQQLEFDFIVAPGADPRRIQFDVRGTKRLRRDGDGDLALITETSKGGIRWHKPVAYQEKKGMRQLVAVDYAIMSGNRVGFKVGKYDEREPLYIDPLIYSTYLGGSGSDSARGIAVDSSGNAYVTGETASTNFPTMNPLQPAYGGGIGNAFVAKLNASGSALVYSTYLGGSGEDGGRGIAVDSSGDAYVTGQTSSTDFPTMNPLQPTNGEAGNYTAFVTKLNPTGSALVYSTYLGGSDNEIDGGSGIAVDSSDEAYVTGTTRSTNFPTMNPLQSTNGEGAGTDTAFVTKLNPTGSALVYSTYLGGSDGESDSAIGIAVDSSGDAYVTGQTASTNFPTMNPLQSTNGEGAGEYTAFVTKLNPTGSALVYSTYLGGSSSGEDGGESVAVDSAGDAYVTGSTNSTNFPTMNPLQPAYGGGAGDAFVTKLNAAGSALVYSTYLGGSGVDGGHGIAVDSSGNAYVTGYTGSTNFPTMNPFQPTIGNASTFTAFVTKLNPAGSALVYSTYLGGSGADNGLGIAADSTGDAYVTGQTASTNFPTMNPLQPAYAGQNDAFVAKFAASTGTDFSLSAANGGNCPSGGNCSTSATVTAGQTATYNLQVSPVNGFNGTVTLSCGDALAKSTCSVSPSSVTVNGTAASALTVTVTTTAASMLGPYSTPASRRPSVPLVLPLLLVLAVALIVAESAVARNPRRRLVPALALLALSLVWIGGCGGGSSSGGGGGNTGTPSGTVTVTGTSSGVSHSLSLTLNVN